MSAIKFSKIAEMLFAFVKEISDKAFKNLQLKNEIKDRESAVLQNIEKEKELQRVNDEFKIISENLPNIIWKAEVTPDGNFVNTYISEIADEILGLRPGTINNNFEKYFSYVVPEFITLLNETIGKGISNPGKPFTCSYQIIKENKELAWVESTGRGYIIDNKAYIFGITVDISEKKRVETQLITSENLLRQSQKVANIGSYIFDIKSGLWESTSFMDEIFGIDAKYRKDITSWLNIIHHEDREMMSNYLSTEILSFHQLFDKEYRIQKINDGEVIWVHGMGELEYDKLGNPVKLIGTIQNINERKQKDNLLRESEERYRTLLDNLPVGVFRSTINGVVLSANPAMAEIYGYNSVEELLQVPAVEYYSELNPRKKMIKKLLKKGYLLDYQSQEYKNDGSLIWISANYKLIEVDGGESYIDGVLIDITQRKNSEEAIQISEEKFRSIAEQTTDVIALTDEKGIITYASPATNELFGCNPEQMIGRNFIDFTEKSEVSDATAAFRNIITTRNRLIDGKFTMKRIDASLFIGELNGSLFKVGPHYGTIVVIRDITERTNTEKLLQENEERFRKLIEHLPIGIAIYHPVDNGNDFRFIDVNKAAEKITNTTIEKLTGHTFLEKFPNMVESPLYEALKRVHTTGEDAFIPSFYYKDKEREGWRENFIYKLHTGEIVAIFRDTTEVKKAEQNLKKYNDELIKAKLKAEQNETRFKALHDASFGGIAIHNKGLILDCNLGLSKMTGYSHDELMGMNGLLLIAERSRKTTMENILAEYEKPYEVFALRKTGEEFPVRLEGRMIPFKGKKMRVVEFRDITEMKKAEMELIRAKEKAEESDRLKSAFLANMSHEIRTPMNGILGFTSLLQEPDLSGEEQKHYIDIIQKSGDRMLNTVNDIIEISKIETGQVSLTLSEVKINIVLEHLYDFFKHEAENKRIQLFLNNDLPADESIIKTDELKIDSILTNLIKNAIKYSNSGFITISCKKESNNLLFTIKDTGIGIPKNRLHAIFERFVQADVADTRVHEGSGLGLAITKSYVEMLGGEIRVESEEGKGSVFYFTIDYIPGGNHLEIEKPKITEIETAKVKELHLLIVEDDDVSSLLMENFFANRNYILVRARNGKEAVEIVRNNNDIDLVLMDLRMPEMDGLEATKKIRAFNSTIPIIAQTAFALQGDKDEAIKAGCNNYISKPINKNQLLDMIKQYIAD